MAFVRQPGTALGWTMPCPARLLLSIRSSSAFHNNRFRSGVLTRTGFVLQSVRGAASPPVMGDIDVDQWQDVADCSSLSAVASRLVARSGPVRGRWRAARPPEGEEVDLPEDPTATGPQVRRPVCWRVLPPSRLRGCCSPAGHGFVRVGCE